MNSSPQFCPNCGAERRRVNARFCHKCGHTLAPVAAPQPEPQLEPQKSRWLLLIGGVLLALVVIAAVVAIGPGRTVVQQLISGLVGKIETPESIPTDTPTPLATKTSTSTPADTVTSPPPTATSTPTVAPPPTDTPPPTGTPSPTPVPPAVTPAPPSAAVTRYFHLSLRDYANSNTTGGYINPPLGQVELGGIPFDLGTGESIVTQANPLPDNPTQLLFSTDIPEPQVVYLLITGGDLWSKYEGRLIGEVRLSFSGGGSHVVDLIAGDNIREWKHYQDNVVSQITSPAATEVWRGGNNDDSGAAVIDMLRIDVPEALRNQTLVGIEVTDQTEQTVGEMDPAINLNGITVASLQIATPTPIPTPTPVACNIQPQGRFATIWRDHRTLLGCATGAAHITSAAWEPFEGGEMFWRGDIMAIVAFFNNGSWKMWNDEWDQKTPAPYRGEPPPGLRTPCCGFAWIWGHQDNVFRNLGWAKDKEKGVCLLVQDFERGFVFKKSNVSTCKDRKGRIQSNGAAELPSLFTVAYDGGQSWARY